MGEPPPGSSPLDGTEPHQNERESILAAENEVPCDLDHQEYENDLRCHEEEVEERDENGFPWDEFIPESVDSINSDFTLSEVAEQTDSNISTFVLNETQENIDSFPDVHLASLAENDVSAYFHHLLLNDGTSELIDFIHSESEEHQDSAYNGHSLNGSRNAATHANDTSIYLPQFGAETSPASPGEVDHGEKKEDSWKIGDNPVCQEDLGNDDLPRIYPDIRPYSPDETKISSLHNCSIEVIADSNSIFDTISESDAILLEDLIRDLGLSPDTMPYKDESMPVAKTVRAGESLIQLHLPSTGLNTTIPITSQLPRQSNQSAIGLAIETPIPSKQSNRPNLSVIDTAFPGTSSQSKQPGLLNLPGTSSQSNQVSVSAMPGPSSQSNQDGFSAMPGTSSQSDQLDLLDLPGTSSQSNQDRLPALLGTSSQSRQIDLSDLLGTSPQSTSPHVDFVATGLDTSLLTISSQGTQPVANQICIGLIVVPVFLPLSGHQPLDHAPPPSNCDNVAILHDDQEKKRKRRESMKIASKKHREKKKAQEDALIAKEKELLKENSELRGKLQQLSQKKEIFKSALKRRKELNDHASFIKRVKISQENTPAEEEELSSMDI